MKLKDKFRDKFEKRYKLQESLIKKEHQELWNDVHKCIIEDISWSEKLYRYFNNVKKPPTCKECDSDVKFKSIGKGYNQFCSKKCINLYAARDKERHRKISKSLKCDYHKEFSDIKAEIESNGPYFIIKNFCSHGDLKIHRNKLREKYSKNLDLCLHCTREKYDNYVLSDDEIKRNRNLSQNIPISNLGQKKFMVENYPLLYSEIIKYPADDFSIQSYMYRNKITKIPICQNDNCNDEVLFNPSMMKFNSFCSKHGNTSLKESKVRDYVNLFEKSIKYRDAQYEIDIYIPSKKIGFEFNGLYYHSDEFRDSLYHKNKYEYFKKKGIKIINIWEDDWDFKRDIVKSIIKNSLGRSEKIYARKCEIGYPSKKESRDFFLKNHIQGYAPSSYNIGLYYKGNLVSLMSFGQRKISSKTSFELLRYSSILGISVIGGPSKIFKAFLKNMDDKGINPKEILSYANLEYFSGQMYTSLGFNFEGYTPPTYWWAKEKRMHRSNFMKHKLVEMGHDPNLTADTIIRKMGYRKIYGIGNKKFIYML